MALALVLLLLLLPVQAIAALGCVVVRDEHNAQQDLKIEQWGENAVRVRAVPSGDSFRDDLVSALVPPTDGFAAAECGTVVLSAAGQTVTSGNLQATVGADGLLTFTRLSDKKVLLSEASVRSLTPTTTVPEREGFYALNISFHATEGERIYGLGQHKTGLLDNVGAKFQLSPMNTEILIPVAHSSLGYAFLMNLPSFGSVELGKAGGLTTWQLLTVIQADFWVATTAPDSQVETEEISPWAQLQHAYANATGHAPVYPEWASGFWQCKNRYHNQSQVIDVARGYIDRGYPISLIIIDYFNWNPNPLGDETLPAACWPDPKGMVDELKQMGVELMISPYFHSLTEQSKYYAKALSEGFIVTNATGQPAKVAFADAYLYDLYNPAARAYAWEAVEAGYIAPYGLHHWWLDCDEPCGGDMNSVAYNNGTWPASFVGAAYPQMVDQMVFEGMGAADKQYTHDNVMLGRSAWAGSQRWGGAVWSGDTHSDFANLNQQFRAGLNLVMSGIPYWCVCCTSTPLAGEVFTQQRPVGKTSISATALTARAVRMSGRQI